MNWGYIQHFTRDEFGYADGVEPDWDLVMRLDQAREIAGVPFVITSGIRSFDHNAAVGGSPTSSHLTGHAVDLRVRSGGERHAILHGVMEAGFDRIGIGGTFIHVDNDKTKPANVVWVY
jgi:uncharacterized protein YcbK (DUF882 family)